MRIAILGCDAIKDELELITAGDPDVVIREYLEFGLHLHPDSLKKVIVEKLAALEGKADLIFLGYAHCQSLQGIQASCRTPVVMLEHEDCIAAMLTTDRYCAEKHNGGITWFYPSGWARYGMPGIINLFELDRVDTYEYPPEYFLKMMFDGFSRCLFIDTGIGDIPTCKCQSENFAQMLQLKHDETHGTLDLMREAWAQAKNLATQMDQRHGLPNGTEPTSVMR